MCRQVDLHSRRHLSRKEKIKNKKDNKTRVMTSRRTK